MDRRELLTKTIWIPAASVITAIAPAAVEAANASRPRRRGIEGLFEEMQPGRRNGLTAELRIIRPDTQSFADFIIDRRTAIFITGSRVRIRQLLEELYDNPEGVNHRLQFAPVEVFTGRASRFPRRVDIDAP